MGGILGVIFGFATQAVLLDEEGRIWWWDSQAYYNWLVANQWLIWLLSLAPGGANSMTIYAFMTCGYLRVGSATLYDAVGAGNP